jgi:hypothetical protein
MDKRKGHQKGHCGREPKNPADLEMAVIDSAGLAKLVGKDRGYQIAAENEEDVDAKPAVWE